MISFIKNLIFPLKVNYIKDNQSLKDLCHKIEEFKICAIDTEFMRNRTYYPILCLIQINVNNEIYIIDPLIKNLNIKPLYHIFTNKKIKKVIHSARHDLEVLFFNQKGHNYHNIIDTQIMANFCSLGYNVGYKLLTKKLFFKKLNDESQRSDWKKRPLSPKQLKYAALDVKYLLKIYQRLEKKLIKQNRLSWFNWEMSDFIKKIKNHDPSEVENLIKRFKLARRDATYIRNIKLLSKIRDDIAKRKNLPRNFIIHDNLVEKILESKPKTIDELEKYKSLQKKINNLEKEQIIAIFNLEEVTIEENNNSNRKNKKFNRKESTIYSKSKNILEDVANETAINKSFIINDKNLKKIISKDIELPEILQNWRFEIFGKRIKALIAK